MSMSKKHFFVFLLFLFIFVSSPSNADKEPIWQWPSAVGVSDVTISEDSLNISASYGNKLSYWYNSSSTPYHTNDLDYAVSNMSMSSSGKYVITGEPGGRTLTFWDNGARSWKKADYQIELRDVDFSADGTKIGSIDLFNVYYIHKSSKEVIWSENHPATQLSAVSVSPDGKYLAIGTVDGDVFVYSTSDSSDVWQHTDVISGRVTDIEFTGDSSHLIIGTVNGRVYVYASDLGDGEDAVIYYDQPEKISCVSASSNPDYYLFGTGDGNLVLLSNETGTKVWQKDLGGGSTDTSVVDCTFNGNGHYVLAGADNSKIVLLANTTTGNVLWEETSSGKVTSVAMSYRGSNIVVGKEDGIDLYYEELLDNQAPIVSILDITPLISLPGTLVNMNASAIDYDGSVVSYKWVSSIDGNLSTEKNFSISNLSQGLHIISFRAMDNEGKWSTLVSLEIGIGDFPDASIDSVTGCNLIDSCVLSEGASIEFVGSASSTASEDTAIVAYEWRSSLDNSSILSTTPSFTTSTLSRGLHVITFRAMNEIEFWSANATFEVLINGIPEASIISATPNPVTPGESVVLISSATDPEDEPLKYIWTSTTLLFANGQKVYENSVPYNDPVTGSQVVTSENDVGSHVISLRVQDSHGVYSEISNVTINILSPPLVLAQCDESGLLGETLLFSTIASDKDGIIVSYEWDFDSDDGDFNSVDFTGSLATHSYNETKSDSDYVVVVKVTDNDGLTAYDECEVIIESEQSVDSSSTDSGDVSGAIGELLTPPIIAGALIMILAIGGIAYYMLRDSDDYSLSSTTQIPPTTTGSNFMDSIVPESSPVKESRIIEEDMLDTTVVECPQCSAQIDIPSISGTQSLQCPECGLEGEIEL